ncbi:MAG: hypothetical protein R8G66_18410 [Cytophagales bacterium]|nr:hypothetical protein [Cytophagales bacterium]
MKRVAFLLTAVIAFALVSCEDSAISESEVIDLDFATEVTMESAEEDVTTITDAADELFELSFGRTEMGARDEILDCATVERDTVNQIITIDFGDGCEGKRGRVRSGKIIVTYDGNRRTEGSFRSVTFDNFFVDSTQVEGTRTKTVTAVDAENLSITVDITLTGGKLTFGDGTSATREAQKTRVWSFDASGDHVTTVSGSASGVNREGVSYSMAITEDIVFQRACWRAGVFVPVSGVKMFTVGESTATIDYGDGECDNLATKTQDGVSEEIELSVRGRRRRG